MSAPRLTPLLSLLPSRALVDEIWDIRVRHLLPDQQVTLQAVIHSEDGDDWHAFAYYISNEDGAVTVSEDVSLGGSYEGVEPMGLLWSMKPVQGSRPGLRLRKRDVSTPMLVHVSVFNGHGQQNFSPEQALACVTAERWYMSAGVRRLDIREAGVKGTLFLPAGPGPFPALLDLWGGGGGLVEYRSALLASHGYAALALEYMSPATASSASTLGNEYFESAFTILQTHPQVCGDRVAILGLSFGTSVALGMAVYSSVIKPRCLVCVSGSHVQPVNGCLADVFAEIKKNVHRTRYDDDNRVIWRDLLLPIPTDPSKKVDMGRIQCPVLLVVGEDDQNWPAVESAQDIEEMMEKAGNRHLLTKLSYPSTGHLIEPPYSPHIKYSNFILAETRSKVMVLWGGEMVPHAHAQQDAWQKTLAFLEQHMYGNT